MVVDEGAGGLSYLTSLGLLGALLWPGSPGPWGAGRGPLGNSWFRRSQGRLRELCGGGGEKENLRSRPSAGGPRGHCVEWGWSGTLGGRGTRPPPQNEATAAAHRATVELLEHSRAALLAVKHTQKEMSHASQRVLVKTREGSRFCRGGGSAYLKPSALGMKRLGLGGSLWQRGTLTGRGLFLGAGRGKKNGGGCPLKQVA